MIVGAIDIGTNTIRLLVADDAGGRWNDIAREMDIVRLGEDVNKTRRIKTEAMERALAALARYKEQMDKLGVERNRAVATSAMRDAENAQDFIDLVSDRVGLTIEVIPGEEEGRLAFSGATGQGSMARAKCVTLVVDIGGGSTEFIYGRSGEMLGATSLDIGSVRLTELFLKNDPPLRDEIDAVRQFIRDNMAKTVAEIRKAKPSTVLAVAGTATQLSALNYEVEPYDSAKIHGSLLRLTDLEALGTRMASMTTEERKKLTGMHPKRADVIVAGELILEEILLELGRPVVIVSEKDILDGIAYSVSS